MEHLKGKILFLDGFSESIVNKQYFLLQKQLGEENISKFSFDWKFEISKIAEKMKEIENTIKDNPSKVTIIVNSPINSIVYSKIFLEKNNSFMEYNTTDAELANKAIFNFLHTFYGNFFMFYFETKSHKLIAENDLSDLMITGLKSYNSANSTFGIFYNFIEIFYSETLIQVQAKLLKLLKIK